MNGVWTSLFPSDVTLGVHYEYKEEEEEEEKRKKKTSSVVMWKCRPLDIYLKRRRKKNRKNQEKTHLLR